MTRREALLAEARRRSAILAPPPDAVAFAVAQGITPDPWQESVLGWRGKRLLLNCSRQAGKSTITAILALHRAIYTPRALILLISPSLRQSMELFRKVTTMLAGMSVRPELTEETKTSLTLANGSRVVSLPSTGDTVRGFSSVSLIIEDEAGFVDDALNTAVRPMLAVSGGQLVLMSTPKGRRGHFFEAWERGGDNWDRIKITGWQVPRIERAFLDEEKRVLRELFRQEYEGEFINAATGLVYSGFDEARNVIDVLPEGGRWHHVLALDFGIVDQNALSVLSWRDHEAVVYVRECYRITAGPTEMGEEVVRLGKSYEFDRVVGDLGGMGKAFDYEIRARNAVPIIAAQKHNKVGFVSLINDALRRGALKVVRATCMELIEEWTTLPWADAAEERSENRQREAAGFPNHASDATLYGWRDCSAFLEEPAAVLHAPGTSEAHEAEESDALERRIHELSRDGSSDWQEW